MADYSSDGDDAPPAGPDALPAGPPPPRPVNCPEADAGGDGPAAPAAPAASSPEESSSERSDTPPVQRVKRELVDGLPDLEKRQRKEETANMDPQAVADLGRRSLRGPYLQRWQELVAEQPRWVWDADEQQEDHTHA
eukprot:s1318_g9.t1